jgi:hypothetical protein
MCIKHKITCNERGRKLREGEKKNTRLAERKKKKEREKEKGKK